VDGEVILDRDASGVWLVTLLGEHDLGTSPGLEATLGALLHPAADGTRSPVRVVVDLTAAEFFDSSVLNALASASSACKRHPAAALAVVVASPDCFADRILRLCGLHRVLAVHVSRRAAVDSLAEDRHPPARVS
jgi:anti-anti-sigma factor